MDIEIKQEVIYCLDLNCWNVITIKDFLAKHRRQVVTNKKNDEGKYMVRRLTYLEIWKLIRCINKDFIKIVSWLVIQVCINSKATMLQSLYWKLFSKIYF